MAAFILPAIGEGASKFKQVGFRLPVDEFAMLFCQNVLSVKKKKKVAPGCRAVTFLFSNFYMKALTNVVATAYPYM